MNNIQILLALTKNTVTKHQDMVPYSCFHVRGTKLSKIQILN